MHERAHDPDHPTPCGPRTLRLPADLRSVRLARAHVERTCRAGGVAEDTSLTAVLLTSETVTNALQHGGGEATITVSTGPDGVLVEVGDRDRGRPRRGPRDPQALGGRGLQIVAALARRWGVREDSPGKVVWFELAD